MFCKSNPASGAGLLVFCAFVCKTCSCQGWVIAGEAFFADMLDKFFFNENDVRC